MSDERICHSDNVDCNDRKNQGSKRNNIYLQDVANRKSGTAGLYTLVTSRK